MVTKNNGPPVANVTTNSAGRIPRAYSVNANETGNNYNMCLVLEMYVCHLEHVMFQTANMLDFICKIM